MRRSLDLLNRHGRKKEADKHVLIKTVYGRLGPPMLLSEVNFLVPSGTWAGRFFLSWVPDLYWKNVIDIVVAASHLLRHCYLSVLYIVFYFCCASHVLRASGVVLFFLTYFCTIANTGALADLKRRILLMSFVCVTPERQKAVRFLSPKTENQPTTQTQCWLTNCSHKPCPSAVVI